MLILTVGLADFQTYHFNPANLSQYIVIIGANKFALIYPMLLDGIVIRHLLEFSKMYGFADKKHSKNNNFLIKSKSRCVVAIRYINYKNNQTPKVFKD